MAESDVEIRRVLEQRYSVLNYLVDRSSRKPELVEALDISRSTVDRSIDDLSDVDCVRKDGGQYVATTTGRLSLAVHSQYRDDTDAVESTSSLVNYLPEDAPLSTDLLRGASVTMADEHAPDRALGPSIDLFKQATEMRGLAPVVLGFYPDLIANQLSESDLTVEIVVEPDVIETLPDLPTIGGTSLTDVGGLNLYQSSRELPYALWLMETSENSHVGITAYNSGGVAVILANDSDDAIRWAEERYESYLQAATSVSVPRK